MKGIKDIGIEPSDKEAFLEGSIAQRCVGERRGRHRTMRDVIDMASKRDRKR
jgi:hypothetical protein